MTELELPVDFHGNTERQGPGSVRETLRALELMEPEHTHLKIADIGCGSGGQTLTLAQNLDCHITAIDLASEFLKELNAKSKKLGIEDRIRTMEKSMEDLPFEKNSLDVIWSEGSIYNIGFESGIKQWRDYLKPGGYLSVSDITWTTHSRPKEIEEYWSDECPEIDTASKRIQLLEENGYILVGYFVLSQNSWLVNYYKPLEERFDSFLSKHDHSNLSTKIVEEYKREIGIYRKYKDYFNYGFYIVKKV